MLSSITLYYFSPTGGTRNAGELFCAALAEKVKAINIADYLGENCSQASVDGAAERQDNFTDGCLKDFRTEPVVVAAPVYGGRIPAIVAEKLKILQGSGRKAVTLAVYGNRAYEDALLELNNVMKESGFTVIASAALVARHSIVPEVAAGRPDALDAAEIYDFARKVLTKLISLNNTEAEMSADAALTEEHGYAKNAQVTVPGNYPYKDSMKVAATPVCGSDCDQCGACAAVCPMGAISGAEEEAEASTEAGSGIKTNLGECILCMACVARCPKQARKLPAPMQEAMNEKLGALKTVRGKNEFYL